MSPGNRLAIKCKKGCSFCCHQRVDIHAMEARHIVKYCKVKGISIDKKYLQVQAKFKALKQAYSNTHSACVFLKNGECSIYEARPIQCRKYFSSSDPIYCDVKKKGNKKNYSFAIKAGQEEKSQVEISFFLNVEVLLTAINAISFLRCDAMPKMLLELLR